VAGDDTSSDGEDGGEEEGPSVEKELRVARRLLAEAEADKGNAETHFSRVHALFMSCAAEDEDYLWEQREMWERIRREMRVVRSVVWWLVHELEGEKEEGDMRARWAELEREKAELEREKEARVHRLATQHPLAVLREEDPRIARAIERRRLGSTWNECPF